MLDRNEKFDLDIKNSTPSIYKNRSNHKKVAIIGAGWFGTHIAIELSKSGYLTTLYEKNSTIFSGISGTFGVRIHAGQHYPRSFSTRKACRNGFYEMQASYPELCNQHLHSIYALGKKDADGKPSKVSKNKFKTVCKEFQYKGEFELEGSPFNPSEILTAYDINEPSAIVGRRLRNFFEKKLLALGIIVKYGFNVTKVQKSGNYILVSNGFESNKFYSVVDTTGFQQTFLPLNKPLPFKMHPVYQPCLALVYEDSSPSHKPISFIVMDGWFPCLMPYDDRISTKHPIKKYIMTHGKWTILGSYSSPKEAHTAFSSVNDSFVWKMVKPACEKEMRIFWPEFSRRFKYIGWKGGVLAKLKTEREFRGSVVFQEPTIGMISVFPGKITNIFDAAREAQTLVEAQDLKISKEGYRYVEGGALDSSKIEIMAPIITKNRNTGELRTFQDVIEDTQKNKPNFKPTKHTCFHWPDLMTINKENILQIFSLTAICFIIIKKINNENKPNSSLLFLMASSLLLLALCRYQNKLFAKNLPKFSFFNQTIIKEENQLITHKHLNKTS